MARNFKDRQEVVEYLNTLPYSQVVDIASEAIMENQAFGTRKITLTREQFEKFFRIQGINAETGEAETRGRKRKEARSDLER